MNSRCPPCLCSPTVFYNIAMSFFYTRKKLVPEQAWCHDFLAEFDIFLEYKPGKENLVANALNRKTELATVCQLKGTLLDWIKMGMAEDPAMQGLVKARSRRKNVKIMVRGWTYLH